MRQVLRSVLGSLVLTVATLDALAGSALAVPNQLAAFQLGEPAPLAYRLLHQGAAFAARLQLCAAPDPAQCLAALALEEPALASRWLLLSPQAAQQSATTPDARLAAPPSVAPRAVGGELSLGNGRELSLQITPTPKRCAPLVKLTF